MTDAPALACTPARYEPAGWVQWPDRPDWSQHFQRVFGLAQCEAATVGECLQVAAAIGDSGVDRWYTEWRRVAHRNLERARSQGASTATTRSSHLRAASYCRTAGAVLEPGDRRRVESLEDTAKCLAAAVERTLGAEQVSVRLADGTELDAIFVAPDTGGPWPAVIAFGGLDSGKDETFCRMWKAMTERRMALLAVDLPGQGATRQMRGVAIRSDVDASIGRCIDFLVRRPDVDPHRIAVCGSSLGGVFAAKAAAAEPRLKAAVSDSIIFDLPGLMRARVEQAPPESWGQLLWAFGVSRPEEVVEACKAFRCEDFLANIRCPWLVVQGEHDFLGLQTALDAYEFAKLHGVDAWMHVVSAVDTGAAHCQADNPTLGQEVIGDWLAFRLHAAPGTAIKAPT